MRPSQSGEEMGEIIFLSVREASETNGRHSNLLRSQTLFPGLFPSGAESLVFEHFFMFVVDTMHVSKTMRSQTLCICRYSLLVKVIARP